MRVSTADRPAPSVTAGRIKCASPPAPDTGVTPNSTEKSSTSSGPSAKLGSEMPSKATKVERLSIAEPLCVAAVTPSGIEISVAMIIAAKASLIVAG